MVCKFVQSSLILSDSGPVLEIVFEPPLGCTDPAVSLSLGGGDPHSRIRFQGLESAQTARITWEADSTCWLLEIILLHPLFSLTHSQHGMWLTFPLYNGLMETLYPQFLQWGMILVLNMTRTYDNDQLPFFSQPPAKIQQQDAAPNLCNSAHPSMVEQWSTFAIIALCIILCLGLPIQYILTSK